MIFEKCSHNRSTLLNDMDFRISLLSETQQALILIACRPTSVAVSILAHMTVSFNSQGPSTARMSMITWPNSILQAGRGIDFKDMNRMDD